MSVNIICIDTALSTCSVALANGTNLLGYSECLLPNTASEQINELINEALSQANLKLSDMQAIAISNGPGSYTGLRIGAAVAKGIAYALNIPIIALPTLAIMTNKAIISENISDFLVVPNIDARRDEVYFAVYNSKLEELYKAQPCILDDDFLSFFENGNQYFFIGNASEKIHIYLQQKLLNHKFIFHQDFEYTAKDMIELANHYFQLTNFLDVAYFEPSYTKPFYSTKK